MKHFAIYCRVSSKSQDTVSQEPDLKRYADAQGEPVVWYRDRFTGKSMDRPGWSKLTGAIRDRKVNRVVVWRLDRLGRTAKGLTALFAELLEAAREPHVTARRHRFEHGRRSAHGQRAGFRRAIRDRGPCGARTRRAGNCTSGGQDVGRLEAGAHAPRHARPGSDDPADEARGRAHLRDRAGTGLSRPTVYARLRQPL